jgi:hypothetical protein
LRINDYDVYGPNESCSRWHHFLIPNVDRAEDENSKLKDAVQTYGGWGAVFTLVPSQMRNQCYRRWYGALDPIISRANGRTCKWMAVEDSKLKLKDVVQTHGGKDLRLTCLVGHPGQGVQVRWESKY